MKRKYTLLKNNDAKQLIIQEYAELDKEVLSLLCEETYETKMIKSAMKSGQDALISTLRTKNLYPPGIYAEKIAAAVVEIYGAGGKDSIDLFFDDIELLLKEREPVEVAETIEIEDETADYDELLDDDFENDYEDKDEINKVDSPLKIADDDFVDLDEES